MKKGYGFTGNQDGMSVKQARVFRDLMAIAFRPKTKFRHGDCIGSDARAHRIAKKQGYTIYIHPPKNPVKRAWCKGHIILQEDDYIRRNHSIVDQSYVLFACPAEFEEKVFSGTWATIRYARSQKRRIVIIFPDGSIQRENFP